jgi:SpoVK/Ycf46/Vps4 family AAA+-type ATPase
MSSFLGRTGSNLRHVMDYAKDVEGVLLLDEIDALAKRRDDAQEVGELKRLVTALLQEIDDWPPTGLLLAATNHPDLLDPAAWRRFEMQVSFPLPEDQHIRKAIVTFAGPNSSLPDEFVTALVVLYRGFSFSDIERDLLQARRAAVLNKRTLGNELLEIVPVRITALPRAERHELASALTAAGVSARKVQTLTGTSRDTIRRRVKDLKEP